MPALQSERPLFNSPVFITMGACYTRITLQNALNVASKQLALCGITLLLDQAVVREDPSLTHCRLSECSARNLTEVDVPTRYKGQQLCFARFTCCDDSHVVLNMFRSPQKSIARVSSFQRFCFFGEYVFLVAETLAYLDNCITMDRLKRVTAPPPVATEVALEVALEASRPPTDDECAKMV